MVEKVKSNNQQEPSSSTQAMKEALVGAEKKGSFDQLNHSVEGLNSTTQEFNKYTAELKRTIATAPLVGGFFKSPEVEKAKEFIVGITAQVIDLNQKLKTAKEEMGLLHNVSNSSVSELERKVNSIQDNIDHGINALNDLAIDLKIEMPMTTGNAASSADLKQEFIHQGFESTIRPYLEENAALIRQIKAASMGATKDAAQDATYTSPGLNRSSNNQ